MNEIETEELNGNGQDFIDDFTVGFATQLHRSAIFWLSLTDDFPASFSYFVDRLDACEYFNPW